MQRFSPRPPTSSSTSTTVSWRYPTPCTEYDVAALLSHVVGWSLAFAAASVAEAFDDDPNSYVAGKDAAEVFRAAASDIVTGWRRHGFDRQVTVRTRSSPGVMVFNMTLMEYFTHGCDPATATGQRIPFSEQEATAVLSRAQGTLLDEYRGAAFGPKVVTGQDAPAVDRMLAFMGRTPG